MSKIVKGRAFFNGATEQSNAGEFISGRQLLNLHVDPIKGPAAADAVFAGVRGGTRDFSGSVFDRSLLTGLEAPAAETAVTVSHAHEDRGYALQTRTIVNDPRIELFDSARFCGTHGPDDKNFNGYERHALGGEIGASLLVLPEIADEGTLSVTVGGSVSGVIDFTGDIDTITVDLVAGQTYLFSLTGTGGSPVTDTFLSIFDPSSTLLVEDDDGGNGIFSLITITAATTGTYTLTAESFSNPGDPGLGEWTLHVVQMGADEAPSAPPSAVVITTGTTYGFIDPAGTDEDVYQITLTAGFVYNFEVAAGADYNTSWTAVPSGEVDTIIRIYNSAGILLFSNDDIDFPDDISSAISFIPETSGIYYVEIDGYGGQSGGYVLDVTETDLSTLNPLDAIDWGGAVVPTQNITVYFAAAGEVFDSVTSLGWNAYEIQQAMAALNTYSQFADLTFSVAASAAGSTFQLVTTNSTQFLGYFNPPGETNAGVGVFARNGDGWDEGDTNGGLEIGGYGWITMIHEFGHGLGLAHPHDNGGGSDVMPGVTGPFGSYGLFDLNQGVYTTMSYNDGWQLHPDTDANGFPVPDTLDYGYQGTPMALDIALIQLKYGAVSANTGNNVYMLLDANVAGTFYQTIWDTGGTDEIAYVGTRDATIDLTAATLDYSPTGAGVVSWVDGIFGGFTIANGVVIENATGGSGNDVLVGNSAANVLTGNDGNDTFVGGAGDDIIHGGTGADTVRYFGNQADYTITAIVGGYTVTDNNLADGDDGTDTIDDITFLQFADGTVNLDDAPGNQAPTLTGLSASVVFNEQAVNGGPQLIDSDVTFEDSDGNFDGGTITVSGALAEDVIGIRNQGTGAGQVGVSGSNVTYGGVLVGTFAGGTGGTTLTVTLNNLATSLTVEAILENLTYANASHSPTAVRTLTINVTDDEGASLAGSVFTPGPYVELTGANDPFANPGILPTFGNGPNFAFVDVNNDGDLDIVVGDQAGTLRYFENNANGTYTEQLAGANPFNGFDPGSYTTPAIMDVDGDGDQDLVVGSNTGIFSTFRNNGNGTWTALTGVNNPFNGLTDPNFSDPAALDIDGDGDIDMISGSSFGDIYAFLNNGSGVFTLAGFGDPLNPFGALDVGSFSSPATGDVDGDGDLDVIIGIGGSTNPSGQIRTFINNGNGTFTEAVGAGVNPFHGIDVGAYALPTLADIDGDGDADLVVGDSSGGDTRVWLNTSTTTPGSAPTVQITVNAQNDAPAGTNGSATIVENTSYTFDESDFGFSDVLEGDDFAGVVITTLPGQGTLLLNGVAVTAGQFVTAADIAASLLVFEPDADENGANYASFTFQVRDDGGTANGGVDTDPTPNSFSFAVTPDNTAPTLTDVEPSVTFLENTVNASLQLLDADVTFQDAEGNFDGGSVVVSGLLAEDLIGIVGSGTGAGQISTSGADVLYEGVVIGTYAGGVGNDFTVTLNALATSAAVEALIEHLGYGNVSDDPTATRTLTINVFDDEGLNLVQPPSFSELTGANNPFAAVVGFGNGTIPTFVDVDGDGDLDLVVGAQFGYLQTFLNDGAGNFTEVVGAANPLDFVYGFGTYTAPAAIDIDGDGDMDLVVGTNYGDLLILENDGAGGWSYGGFLPGSDIGSFSVPTVVDLDNDGLDDIIVGELNGNLNYFHNNGGGSFSLLTGANNPLNSILVDYFSAAGFVDLDGDGDLDVVVGDYYGGLTAFTNEGGTFVLAANNPFSGFTFSSIPAFTFVDLDGDGDLDGIAGSFDGDIRTFQNNSSVGVQIVVNVTPENDIFPVELYDENDVLLATYATIQAAVNAASDGYRIYIGEGTYNENVTVNVDVTIQGANAGVAGTGTRGAESVINGQITIAADGVTIDGVSVTGDAAGPLGTTGIIVGAGSDDFSLVNSILDGDGDFAIFVHPGVTGLDIGYNLIQGYSIGVYVSGGTTAGSIHDNLFQGDGGPFTGLGNGVNSETSHVLIQNNIFDGIYSGVLNLFPFGPDPVDIDSYVIGNTLTGNAAPRPVQIYPTADSTNIIGTDYDEAFNGDVAGLASGTVLTFDGQGGDDHIYGFDAGDTLLGGDGNDRIFGQGGDDLLTGGVGNDLLDGGGGIDSAFYADASVGFSDTVLGWVITSASEGNDLLQNTEIVVGGGGQRTLLVGATGFGTVQAALTSAANGDIVRLASGNYSGTGAYSASGLTVIAQAGAVQNLTYSTAGTFGITIFAADSVDHITTGAGDDLIFGGGGADVLNGGDGNDVLYGEGGIDTLIGGLGDDVFIVDNSTDIVIEAIGEGNDSVLTQVSYLLTSGADVELLSTTYHAGTAAIELTGNYGNQTIIGNWGNNVITGGVGADVLIGLAGDDVYIVHDAQAVVVEDAGSGNDIVFTSVSYALAAGADVETLSTTFHGGTAAIDLTGSDSANTIYGNAGDNVLDGRDGSDILIGFGGADTFAFTTALGAGNVDIIADFEQGVDRIALDDAIFTELGGLGTLSADAFVTGTAAADADDRIIYDAATGQLFYDADGNGDGAAVLFATVSAGLPLTASDFLVI